MVVRVGTLQMRAGCSVVGASSQEVLIRFSAATDNLLGFYSVVCVLLIQAMVLTDSIW